MLERATNQPGADGVLGTADDVHQHENTTTPFVDQNQTYTSHPSHQVFLREYELNAAGRPVATGRLLVNRTAGADGQFFTADDVLTGGMATWAVVKAQARNLLGINLTDADVINVPLLVTDQYGKFIPGPARGFAQIVVGLGPDGVLGTADDAVVEGNRAAPISTANALRTGHAFLNDIARSPIRATRRPARCSRRTPTCLLGNNDGNAGTYDNELLDQHYIAGDGRVNENIGLTAVHHVFHSEHNRLVEHIKARCCSATRRCRRSSRTWQLRRRARGTASACSRRRSSAPRCSTSTWCSRSSRARCSRTSTRSSRQTGYDATHQPGDRRRVRAHGVPLRPLDADRDGRPARPELRRRPRSA